MSPLVVDSEAIHQFLQQYGLHFLLSTTGNTVMCNHQVLSQSVLTKRLYSALGTSTLLCAFGNQAEAQAGIEAILNHPGIPLTSRLGMRPVMESADGSIYLRGGSYSSARVHLNNGSWTLIKQCGRYHHPDKDERLIAEIESIAELPIEAQTLFPTVYRALKNEQLVRYEMAYVPYPDFADVVRSGQYTADHLSGRLHAVYDQLFEKLYLPIVGQPDRPSNYVEIIRPRLQELRNALLPNDQLLQLLNADHLVINGSAYRGLEQTLQLASDYIRDYPLPATYNHGDLILQDILLNPVSGDFKLVDSNGHSTSYVNDIAKMLLCLETKYDLFYEGSFQLQTLVQANNTMQIDFTFTDSAHLQTLNAMHDNFLSYLDAQQSHIFRTVEHWPQVIRVLCGLQNIAIVMFHALHHRKPERASAFLACGIKLINDTMSTRTTQ